MPYDQLLLMLSAQLNVSSTPLLEMVVALVMYKLSGSPKMAGIGTGIRASFVFLSYQSNVPVNRFLRSEKSRPRFNSSVFSQPKSGSVMLGILMPWFREPEK